MSERPSGQTCAKVHNLSSTVPWNAPATANFHHCLHSALLTSDTNLKYDTHFVSHKLLTQTKIRQHHVAIRIKQNILKLNVTVYNPQL